MTIETGGRRPPTPYNPPQVSWEDYLPWALASEFPSEWVDGEIIEIMPSNVRHQRILRLLLSLISLHVERHKLGEVFLDFLMRLHDRPSGRVPDIMFVRSEHKGRVRNTFLEGPADLAIEIVSLDSETRDRREKLAEYQSAGILEYWLIDEPRHQALFFSLGQDGLYQDMPLSDDGIFTSAVVPGLRLKVDWLWRDTLPTVDEALADLPD